MQTRLCKIIRMESNTQFLADGTAYSLENKNDQAALGVTYIHGLKSDRNGLKADALGMVCRTLGLPYLRYDVVAHGETAGAWADFSVLKAVEQATQTINTLCHQPQIIVGSSMGGWVGLKLLQNKAVRAEGFIGIAASADFTLRYESRMTETQRASYTTHGYYDVPSPYSAESYRFHRSFIEDSAKVTFLDKPCGFEGPVHLLQSTQDELVPKDMPEKIAATFTHKHNLIITRLGGSDHRLTTPRDLAVLKGALWAMYETLARKA